MANGVTPPCIMPSLICSNTLWINNVLSWHTKCFLRKIVRFNSVTRQRNILLIEGDLMVRQALGHVLEVGDYRVVSARNQHEALRQFSSQSSNEQIDIVLLDLNSCNGSAWETVERLTALEPNLPVVAMTCRGEHTSSSIALAFDAFMEKPLNLILLLRTLNELTSQTRPPRSRLLESASRGTHGNQSAHYE